ncbi:SGNH/GDSL hydrolase family protein [Cytobacillus sp. Hz8]|uniref:SGNH/GDSL hydrolase family protein n=1 Tax=Cytobacillus sp. Hz8 TaxID=3347168 RepID=UPI0035DE1248
MKKYFVLFISFFCVVVLYLGHQHWKNKTVSARVEGEKISEMYLEKNNGERIKLIESLNSTAIKKQSLIDFLRYKSLTEDKASIAVLGSNLTAGTGASNTNLAWSQLLKRNLQSKYQELKAIKLLNYGFEGYSTDDLLKGKKIDALIKEQPDLVIFENSMHNNYSQSITIQKSVKDLTEIMDKVQRELPNAKIIIMSPNPIANSKNKNSLGLEFSDYIRASENIINKNKWTYINCIEEINKKVKAENVLLVDILANDYLHPNDKGHFIISEVLTNFLEKSS